MSVAPVCVVCWSAKGGSGTSVVAAALALKSADCGRETLLVDLDGDQPDVLGVSPGGLGVTDWLAAGDDVPVDALAGMEVPVIGRLRLLPRGEEAAASNDRLRLLAGILSTGSRTIVIDAGTRRREAGKLAVRWWDGIGISVLVTRACYLALRRVDALPPGTRLVLVDEPGRARTTSDVVASLGVPLWRRVGFDPSVARAVDAGLLATRRPRALRQLDPLAL
jgi:hypothetical protein